MTLPAVGGGSPRVVTYTYDPTTDDLTSVTDWTAVETVFTYDGLGLPYQVARPNGITTTYGYDSALRLTGISHEDTTTSTYLAEYGYQYDFDGNRTRVDITGSAVTNGYETYGYDALDRLTNYRDLGGTAWSYAYGANGNRTSVGNGTVTTSYEYDAADQLQKIDGVDLFDYDGNGNRIAYGTNTYSWDWANRLTGATVAGTSATYDFLGDGSRASKSVGSGTPVTTDFLWDRASGLPRLLDDGTTSAVRAGSMTAEVDNAGNGHAWDLTEALGSVRAQTDDTAAVTGTADWDVWGNTSAGRAGLFGWDGEQSDPETGLSFLRARSYSPVFGQFLSRDPLGAGNGTQRSGYAFASDSPATLGDTSSMRFGSARRIRVCCSRRWRGGR